MKQIQSYKIILPALIGIGVVLWLFFKEFDVTLFENINFGWNTLFWIVVAFLFMVGRDLGYIIRLRILTHNEITLRQAFRIVMLWESTSAITPSAIGGTSVAVLYLYKEGIPLGRSGAVVMLTSLLDELYFVIMFPLFVAIVGLQDAFEVSSMNFVSRSIVGFAVTGYFLKLAWVLLLSYGLFLNPKGVKWMIVKVFSLPFLKRWKKGAEGTGNDIVESSKEIKRSNFAFWSKASLATILSWSSRYLVANAVILALFGVGDHILLFARQLIMWIMMLVIPTPGGAGFSELIFQNYCSDLILVPDGLKLAAAATIALLWRAVTYYPYLFIGAIVFPRWIGTNFKIKKKSKS